MSDEPSVFTSAAPDEWRIAGHLPRSLALVAIEGMRPAEAAAVCGVTPEAMRQRLSRARAAMARRLGDRDDRILVALKAVMT